MRKPSCSAPRYSGSERHRLALVGAFRAPATREVPPMRVSHIGLLLAIVAASSAVPATASAATSFGPIGPRADREFRGLSVLVPINYSCRADTNVSLFVELQQVRTDGSIARGFGFVFRDYTTPNPALICDDTPRVANIRVTPAGGFGEPTRAFQLGAARASGSVSFSTFTEPNFVFQAFEPSRIRITRSG